MNNSLQRKEYIEHKGLCVNDYELWKKKWENLRHDSKKRGSGFFLTFEQYIDIAVESNITDPTQIGKSLDSYQMGRIGDVGDYVVGNCRFITMKQNLEERCINGGTRRGGEKQKGRSKETDECCRIVSSKLIGRTKYNDASKRSASEKISKNFKAISPDGETIFGRNLNQFCKDNGLNRTCMEAVARGTRKHHQGWTCEYVGEFL